ncbi:LysE family translocator [Hydrogenophaga electricum]|uniref:Transporter n=1 Tax=Hydrogenophaga electricum TaxID=1230953 RepID=A0ABQ6C318_9BURK|nr:LysE family transporter [Hydrogenophaga electricum]GLS14743.1 transporter [Hydrogenophaga electricum]
MEQFASFLLVASLAVLSPGPGVAMTLGNAMHHGLRGAASGILGLAIGAMLIGVIASSGLSAALKTSDAAMAALKFMGAAYLVYLGMHRWWTLARLSSPRSGTSRQSHGRRFMEGVLLQLTNPKAVLFMLAMFPQFITPQKPVFPQFLLLTLTYSLLDILIHAAYAAAAHRARPWLRSEHSARLISRISGTLFVLFGLLLVML